MKQNKKVIRILELVLKQIADIYLYFLGFYVVCLIPSYFFERWKLFFNWPAFHLSIIFLGILVLLSKQGREFRGFLFKLIKFRTSILTILKIIAKSLASAFALKIKGVTKKDYLKFVLILLILVYVLFKEIDPINFLILGYALFSILFVLESRISASIALLFLISCPILLIMEKEPLAEQMAIYAYYFLVITVAVQIREYLREEKEKNVIHN